MSIKKLLAATSFAALMVGGANAQLVLNPGDPTAPAIGGLHQIYGDAEMPYELANEFDLAAAITADAGDDAVQVGLELLTQGAIPPGQNIFLTVTVSGATFASNLSGNGEFGATDGITGATVNAGGQEGQTSVRYLLTSDASTTSIGAAPGDGIRFSLPIKLSSCGDVTFNVTEFQTESDGTIIEGGTASLATSGGTPVALNAIECVDAYQATLAVDTDSTALDVTSTPAFSDFVVAAPDLAAVGVLGDFEFDLDVSAHSDLDNTPVAVGDIEGLDFDVDFVSSTGIEDGSGVPAGGQTLFAFADVAIASNTISVTTATEPTATSETGVFELDLLTGGSTATVPAQTVSVSDAFLLFDLATLVDTDPFLAADVEDLKYNGSVFGPYDWVNAAGLVNSIFRVTGLPAADVLTQIIVTNSNTGVNGTFTTTLPASSITNGEARLNSAWLLDAVGQNFGTADITFVFSEGGLDLDVDRLNASPQNVTVTPYGDGANQDGTSATDNTTLPGPENNDDGSF